MPSEISSLSETRVAFLRAQGVPVPELATEIAIERASSPTPILCVTYADACVHRQPLDCTKWSVTTDALPLRV
ncbi:hypothetical protein ASA1KI_40350 [Opitutales bacterium ASA1]|uniref:hypothetical protein n=1 Tax=Congregicoccus parvus TaxID=3081749 RepID=UPI002B3248F1|nr:hypothetical protein ASA1KI_40350 [Opitutales bacterium ASA1]